MTAMSPDKPWQGLIGWIRIPESFGPCKTASSTYLGSSDPLIDDSLVYRTCQLSGQGRDKTAGAAPGLGSLGKALLGWYHRSYPS